MVENVIVCCDGTNNRFGPENTNVVRLVQCIDRTAGKQRVYYDPGFGTLPEPGWIPWLGSKISRLPDALEVLWITKRLAVRPGTAQQFCAGAS
jgi:hypothetical protein